MKAVRFPECNTVFAEGNEDHETYAFVDNSKKGNKDIVSCYRLSFLERLLVMVTGRMWVNITSFNGKLHPMRLSIIKQTMILTRKQARNRNKAVEEAKSKENPSAPINKGLHAT